MQKLNLRYEEAREWDELPLDEVEAVISRVLKQMERLQQRAEAIINDSTLFPGSGNEDVDALLSGYRRYVLDMQSMYQRMLEIYQRRLHLTEADLKSIDTLTQQAEEIGNRARTNTHELPALRIHLRNQRKLTEKQNDQTLHLQQIYYPMNSGFGLLRSITLSHPVTATTEQTETLRRSLIVQSDEDIEETDTPVPGVDDPISTLPMTFDDFPDDLEQEEDILATEPDTSDLHQDSSESDNEEQ